MDNPWKGEQSTLQTNYSFNTAEEESHYQVLFRIDFCCCFQLSIRELNSVLLE